MGNRKRQFLSIFVGIVTGLSAFSNAVFAEPVQTSYQPSINNGGADAPNWVAYPFAIQPLGYPWCMITCLKIVLRDVNDRYPGGGGNDFPDNLNAHAQTFRAMAAAGERMPLPPALVGQGDPVLTPIDTQANSRGDIEKSIVRNLFLQNRTITSAETIDEWVKPPEAPRDIARRDAFKNLTNNLFGLHLSVPLATLINGIPANDVRRIRFFDGLFGILPIDDLQTLWGNLCAPQPALPAVQQAPPVPQVPAPAQQVAPQIPPPPVPNIEKVVCPISNQESLAEIHRMTGLTSELHNVTRENYDDVVHKIALEIATRRMVIVLFRDPLKPNSSHACVAYQADGQNLGGGNIDIEGGPYNTVYLYNPWGVSFQIENKRGVTNSVNWDINNGGAGDQKNWDMFQYITFTYQ